MTLYCLSALFYSISSINAPYPMSPIIKALPVFMLMAWVWFDLGGKSNKPLMFALGFSSLGDIMLALEFNNSFMLGLGAFLVAHVFYILVFLPFCRDVSKSKVLISALLVIYCLIMATFILPEDPVLKIAVVVYMLVLGIMCCSAIFSAKKSTKLHTIGALVFALSDSIIAWDAFLQPVPYSSVLIMTSYYLAQICIIYGCIHLIKINNVKANSLREN